MPSCREGAPKVLGHEQQDPCHHLLFVLQEFLKIYTSLKSDKFPCKLLKGFISISVWSIHLKWMSIYAYTTIKLCYYPIISFNKFKHQKVTWTSAGLNSGSLGGSGSGGLGAATGLGSSFFLGAMLWYDTEGQRQHRVRHALGTGLSSAGGHFILKFSGVLRLPLSQDGAKYKEEGLVRSYPMGSIWDTLFSWNRRSRPSMQGCWDWRVCYLDRNSVLQLFGHLDTLR